MAFFSMALRSLFFILLHYGGVRKDILSYCNQQSLHYARDERIYYRILVAVVMVSV